MSRTEQLHRGSVIRHQGRLYTVLDFWTSQSGKQRPTVHVQLRSIKDGHAVERSLDELGKIDEVATQVRTLQFLYAAGDKRVFMDNESFEEYAFDCHFFGKDIDLLVEGEAYRFLAIEGQPVSLQMPPAVAMAVVDTAPAGHAAGSNVTKEAKLASGLLIRVPLFIQTGDRVRLKTDTREYCGKEH